MILFITYYDIDIILCCDNEDEISIYCDIDIAVMIMILQCRY